MCFHKKVLVDNVYNLYGTVFISSPEENRFFEHYNPRLTCLLIFCSSNSLSEAKHRLTAMCVLMCEVCSCIFITDFLWKRQRSRIANRQALVTIIPASVPGSAREAQANMEERGSVGAFHRVTLGQLRRHVCVGGRRALASGKRDRRRTVLLNRLLHLKHTKSCSRQIWLKRDGNVNIPCQTFG